MPDLNPDGYGSVLKSPTKEDGHCVAVMGITKNGFILVAANHHGDPWRCVISENPHDISAWKRAPYATDSKVVTYPRFVSYPDGTLQAFWREGSSGNGVYYGATFNDETMLFNPKVLLIDAQASNPYEQRIVVDDAGTLHLCWGYRTDSQNADTNFGLFYAKSTDKGATFTSADGSQQYALPLSGSNAEKIIDAPAGSGYCNQNGACHDLENNYHTVIWQYDREGATQICHIWFDGTQWQQELVSRFNFAVALNVPTLDGALCRPLIFCTNLGRLYAAYHMTGMGRRNDIRVIDVTEPGAPVDYCVAKYDVGTIELAVNTDMVKRGGDLCMLATRGASGVERPGYKQFVAESAYLMTANLPMQA
ncbi:BNR-4 repeat-containing protein [Klebsiella pasteurii]|uniref:BNR-4 repeat-containing protein n=1 Tax=Klebsiella pasteurii TaxID=2587529 RepID=UPI0022A78071|nr:BNR-4 repeat-containing protein [Klebsiella pasteurii]